MGFWAVESSPLKNRTYKVNWSPTSFCKGKADLSEMFSLEKAILLSLERSAAPDVTAWNPFSETTFIRFVSCSIFFKRPFKSFQFIKALLWAPRILQAPRLLDMEMYLSIVISMLLIFSDSFAEKSGTELVTMAVLPWALKHQAEKPSTPQWILTVPTGRRDS